MTSSTAKKSGQRSEIVRIGDIDTQRMFDELIATKVFASKNALLNKCLNIGVAEIHSQVFGKGGTHNAKIGKNGLVITNQTDERLSKELRQIRRTDDEIYISINILEVLVTTLYNMTVEQLEGHSVSAADLESGRLSALPVYLQSIKDELVESQKRAQKQDKEKIQ